MNQTFESSDMNSCSSSGFSAGSEMTTKTTKNVDGNIPMIARFRNYDLKIAIVLLHRIDSNCCTAKTSPCTSKETCNDNFDIKEDSVAFNHRIHGKDCFLKNEPLDMIVEHSKKEESIIPASYIAPKFRYKDSGFQDDSVTSQPCKSTHSPKFQQGSNAVRNENASIGFSFVTKDSFVGPLKNEPLDIIDDESIKLEPSSNASNLTAATLQIKLKHDTYEISHSEKSPLCDQREVKTTCIQGDMESAMVPRLDHQSFECRKCKILFNDIENVRAHVRETHITGSKCGLCANKFKSVFRHIMRVHFGLRLYPCTQCGKKFHNLGDVQHHMATHSTDRSFSCAECSKTFKSKKHVRNHVKRHSNLRPFACSQCGKYFKTKAEVRTHMWIHSEERLYACLTCSKSYKSSLALSNHSKIHSEKRSYACLHCHKSFKCSSNLMSHMKRHSLFVCDFCGKSCNTKNDIRSHMSSHLDDRIYECDLCDWRFGTAGRLKVHRATHSNERLFACKYCHKAFRTKHHADSHMKNNSCKRKLH